MEYVGFCHSAGTSQQFKDVLNGMEDEVYECNTS